MPFPLSLFHTIAAKLSSLRLTMASMILMAATCGAHSGGKEPAVPVALFERGIGGYSAYRIPALAVSAQGTLLAFCEGRKNSVSDTGDIDLLLRRSIDGGRTWSTPIVVWDSGSNVSGNPSPVIDKERGRIFLLTTWNLGEDHEKDIRNGTSKDTRRVFVQWSDDDGEVWSEPTEITHAVKKPEWQWFATGPGGAIQLTNSSFAGRLVIPFNFTHGERLGSGVFYSDDHGETWQRGGEAPANYVNESQVVELADGTLHLNMRNHEPRAISTSPRARKVAISRDGGITWGHGRVVPELVEPVCQGAVTLWQPQEGKDILLFSNPANSEKRIGLTLKGSADNGETWPYNYLIHERAAAYSDLAVLPNGSLGVLFEAGQRSPYEAIFFTTIEFNQLVKD